MGTTADELTRQVGLGQYEDVLTSVRARDLISEFAASLLHRQEAPERPATKQDGTQEQRDTSRLAVAQAAFNAFLQTNVTGPVLRDAAQIDAVFHEAAKSAEGSPASLRKACFTSLDVDGVSPYAYIPSIELFCLARYVFTGYAPESAGVRFPVPAADADEVVAPGPSLRWHGLRVRVWHYKLLTQPSLGPGSLFNKSHQWSDIPTLEQQIQTELAALEEDVMHSGPDAGWSAHDKARFCVEKANICIMLGQDKKARAALEEATQISHFKYALSGALGKRTKFQETSTSQLVVLAKSVSAPSAAEAQAQVEGQGGAVPQALPLNDDTLLENVAFTAEDSKDAVRSGLPDELKDMPPDAQPQLDPLDQIILLTEATLKDAFSPADSLTSEEILPFATRVVADKSTNWQIYTHALLLRSRIELHRSRTLERGVLQLQAVVDQVIVDTTDPTTPAEEEQQASEASPNVVPVIEVSGPDGEAAAATTRQPNKPTSFLPAAKPADSAPAHVRLEYIHALSSPPRWHLESELAYAWAGVGSLVSALEIFKRLRLWAEVALCLASSAATEDADGRGSGGEEKSKAILRWRLFHRTDGANVSCADPDLEFGQADVDVSELEAADYHGPERHPPPPNAPRLLCILGDIEDEPRHYERAWDISKKRFARAQKSLGEYHLRQKHWLKARESYQKAVLANRLNPELWNRLGDIYLRLGEFSDAAEAYQRAISSANDVVGGEDARTWSNLGSALYSLYVERVTEMKKEEEERKEEEKEEDDQQSSELVEADEGQKQHPSVLLSQSLAAYKRGASIANDNWRIWDNVITLAARMRPPPVSEILFALQHVIRIRNSEDVLDMDVLRLLLNEAVLSQEKPEPAAAPAAVYEPPRGSNERAICDLLETVVVPLITTRPDLWELVARERVWRRDYAGAVDAAERAWRAAVGGAGVGLAASAASAGDGKSSNWLEDQDAWTSVAERTDELVSALENYGPEVPEIGAKWKFKARTAIRSVMGKAKASWEGSTEWKRLQELVDGLK